MKDLNNTLDYYNRNASEYAKSTVSADMSSLRDEFLCLIPPHSHILDCGCGSGRDTLAFLRKGYSVTPIDGSEEMCRCTTELTGIKAERLLFDQISFQDRFGGIWACASLLHAERSQLPGILKKLHRAAKQDCVLYMSFKFGSFTGQRDDGRFFTNMTERDIPGLLSPESGWEYIKHSVSADRRTDGSGVQWLNIFARKM